MFRPTFSGAVCLALLGAATPAFAQDVTGPCVTPDTIAVRGNTRVSESTIRGDMGLAPGVPLSFPTLQRGVRALFESGQFADVRLLCGVADRGAGERATLTIEVVERPLVGLVGVTGAEKVATGTVRDRVAVEVGRPLDPAQVAKSIQRIDSLYESKGYYLAQIRPETTYVDDRAHIIFRIDEGSRLAVAGVRVAGNDRLSDKTVVDAMKTQPEGFFWFRKGEFDEDLYAGDVAERLPALYAGRGFIDFQIVRDTVLIDRDRGKAFVDLTLVEGLRYRVGSFDAVGNRRFSTEEIERFYPFTDERPTLADRLKGIVRRDRTPRNVFDQKRWDDAVQAVRTAYNNEGYIYASVRPVMDRQLTADSTPVVNLRWEIDEKQPAIINRVTIAGNDYTSEACIRQQLVILPGDVFNQDRLLRSWYNIANLNFFETPLPEPDVQPANDEGDVDVTFAVKEKRTGNIQFGASMGQGTGVGGFIGLDQPNLFGLCKRGSLQWQFGQYINDFNLSFTDPSIEQSQISGTATAYHTQSRFRIKDLGRSTRTGGSLQLGFPVPNSPFARIFVSYGGESVKFTQDAGTLLGSQGSRCFNGDCFRSTLGLSAEHDTRVDLPFPSGGSRQSFSAQFNGGPLGGTSDFQRYTTELKSYALAGLIGGNKPGSQPLKVVLGLTGRAGALFGDAGPFFYSQEFALGGTQFGEMLRGYDEFSITPAGHVGGTGAFSAQRESFGSAFFSATAELGLRINQQVYVNSFFDAGNVWNHPRDFNPTRLFRGAGLGVSLITPLGPLGLDWAYGFDRVDEFGRPDPKWQLHFKLGQIF